MFSFNIVFLKIQSLLWIFNLCFLVFVFNFVPLRTQSSVTIFTWEWDHWPDCSRPLWISFFSTRSPLSPPSPFSSLLNSVNLFVCSGLWRALRELITGWMFLSPFDVPLYPPSHLCFLPPSSLLCVTLWTSLRDPYCGEHKRKWLLASLLSPLLIPHHLIQVTSISLLSLLFSM